jgi:hypothetical protein
MKDWLKLLNFEMRGGRFGCYRPPFESEPWLARLGFLEHAGDRWWPVAGAVYLMQAKKRVAGMRLITPSWRQSRLKNEALAPTVNGARNCPGGDGAHGNGAHGNGANGNSAHGNGAHGNGANGAARATSAAGITHQSPWKEPQHD